MGNRLSLEPAIFAQRIPDSPATISREYPVLHIMHERGVMERSRTATVALFLLFGVVGACKGGELAYVCTVEHVYNVSDYGKLIESELDEEMEGARFAISRSDGKILGEVLTTSLADSTRVVSRGSHSNSFMTIADFGEKFQSLEVQEFREGERKPFVALAMGGAGIVTGFCR